MEAPKELVSIDTILDYCKEQVENRIPVPPSIWLDWSWKLDSLLGDLDEDLVKAELAYNRLIANSIKEGQSATAAKLLAKATEEYAEFQRLVAKRDRVYEFIRIAKKRTEVRL